MHGTPTEVAVANALAAAMADEQRESAPARAALLKLWYDDHDAAAFIKDVVVAGHAKPIPLPQLPTESDRNIVYIDLTDGGTVWVYDLDGDPRWLPREEFEIQVEDDDAASHHIPLDAIIWMIFLALVLGALAAAALWFEILPGGH